MSSDNFDIVPAESMVIDLSKAGPEAVIERILKTMKRLDDTFPYDELEGKEERTQEWIANLRRYIGFCTEAKEKFSTAEAVGLAYMKRHWDQLPLSFRKKFNMDFYVWACAVTKNTASTIDNHLRAVETFFFDGIAPKLSIEVPVRDANKKIVIDPDTGKPKTEIKKWNPLIPPISKLVLARSKAVNNGLTRQHWAMLMDDGCTWEQFQIEMSKGGGGGAGGNGAGIHYRLEGTGLYAVEDAKSVAVGELSFKDYYENPDSLTHRAINRLMLMLGINLDEQLILRQQAKKDVDKAYGKK